MRFIVVLYFFFFKQKTAYDMRISDWSSDVCSSDLSFDDAGTLRLCRGPREYRPVPQPRGGHDRRRQPRQLRVRYRRRSRLHRPRPLRTLRVSRRLPCPRSTPHRRRRRARSEEHTSELQSLMPISYAVFSLKKTKSSKQNPYTT